MLRKLLPHLHVNTVQEIDLHELKQIGIKGIITDLDNTLVGAKEPLATPKLAEWLKRVRELGFEVVVVSNNSHSRVSTFAAPLNLPYIHGAKKPRNLAFNKALLMMKCFPDEVVVIGDQMLTDVYGGNRLGLYTILVKPISLRDEKWMTKINRRLEKLILRTLKKEGLISREDDS